MNCPDLEEDKKLDMIEVWNSLQAHQASGKSIASEKLSEIRPLLAASPSGSYLRLTFS